jgi:methionine sulfoxide reductase heme-binding subunit
MSPQLWWYVARATGIVGWALLAASVIWGLLLSTRLARGRPTPAWLLDLHRFLGGSAVAFTALHLVGLVADNYVDFGLVDLLVPYASSWKPGPVALGVVSVYLLAVVEGTSLAMRRISRRLWRAVHLSSYVLFWTATFHFILAGTDAPHPLARAGIDVVAAAVVFLTLVRVLSPRGRQRADRGVDGAGSRPSTRPSHPRRPDLAAGRS